jgi:hypothetical protein
MPRKLAMSKRIASPVRTFGRFQYLDRREWPRFQADPEISCNIEFNQGKNSRRAKVLNLSSGGVGFVSDLRVDAGSSLTILLTASTGLFSSRRSVIVRHAGERFGGGFHLGCEFVNPLRIDELQALL